MAAPKKKKSVESALAASFKAETKRLDAEKKAKKKKPVAKKKPNPMAAGLDNPIREFTGPPWMGDPQIIQARKRIATWISKVDVPKLLDELTQIHSASSLRSLKASDLLSSSQVKLVEASLQNSASRSRCVEIKISAMRAAMTCKTYLDTARRHIQHSYDDAVKESGTTVGDRKAFVDSAFIGEIDSLEALDQILKTADNVIEDFDKSAWGIKSIIETLAQSIATGGGNMKR